VGHRAASPNRRFTLLWSDRYWLEGSLVGGRYFLVERDVVAAAGSMERPQDGKVADDGTFILNDWGASDDLSGTFHAFRADGSEILSRRFSANLLNNGLSRDGRLAVCQTCNAPGSPDSSILALFDRERRAEVASWVPESGWAKGYEFPGGERIRMLRGDRQPLDYSLAGEFLDRRLWLKDEVRRGTLYVIRKALAEGEAATGLPMDALRAGVARAIADEDQRFVADAWRLLGEIEEAAGDAAAALEAYEQALAINPKIGVAKKAASLRKAKGT
jgi:tetratricopeptide (TPR) repeat protein